MYQSDPRKEDEHVCISVHIRRQSARVPSSQVKRLHALKGLIIYWQIQAINQIDGLACSLASSDRERRPRGAE